MLNPKISNHIIVSIVSLLNYKTIQVHTFKIVFYHLIQWNGSSYKDRCKNTTTDDVTGRVQNILIFVIFLYYEPSNLHINYFIIFKTKVFERNESLTCQIMIGYERVEPVNFYIWVHCLRGMESVTEILKRVKAGNRVNGALLLNMKDCVKLTLL